MSFNGSGTFVINSAGQPVVANTVISATTFNALTADLANGLTTCITKDGQSTPTANIPMGGFKITNLATGTAATDAATVAQIQSNGAALVTVTGTDTLTGSLTPALVAYVTGAVYYFVAPATNTGAVTLNIDTLGAKNVTRDGTTALVAGDIVSGEMVAVVYDGTRFQLISPVNSFTNLNVSGTLTVAGATTLNGNLAVGDAAADTINFKSSGWTLTNNVSVIGTWADIGTITTADINGGTIDGTTIGGGTAAAGTFTTATATTGNITTVNATTVDSTNLEVTNLKAKDGTAAGSIADATGVVTLNSVVATTADINGGTIDATTIGGSSPAVGNFTTVSAASAVFTTATITTVNTTTLDLTNLEVTNIKAKDGTASMTIDDATGKVNATTVSAASMNAGVAAVTSLTATGASVASANVGTAVITNGTVTALTATGASIASMNAGVALLTTATVTNFTASGASIASANIGNLQFTAASIASINAGVAVITSLTATGASIASANVGTAVITAATVTGASIASMNAGVALLTTATVTNLTATGASVASANVGTAVVTGLTVTGASIASVNAGVAVLSGNLTLNGGTANGVLYLNGSKVATSGSAFVFDGTNVGIGTASPDANFKLDVQAATGRVKLTSTTGTNSVVYQANNTGGTLNVGIDSSTGGSLFGVGAYAAGVWYSGNYPLVFGVNNAEGFRLTSSTLYTASGINVGIGTSSPSKKLDIRANVLGESALVLISNDNTAGTGGSPTVASLEFASSGVAKASIAAAVYGNDWLSFRTGSNTERMRLTTSTLYTDSSINVGIGTSSPATKLDTAGTVRSTAQTVPSSGTGAELFYDATNAGLRGYNRTGAAYVNLALNDNMYVGGGSSGNVGIGTSSPDIFGRFYTRSVGISSSGTTGLQINGTTYGTIDLGAGGTRTTSITGSSTEAQVATVTSIPLLFLTNGAERARITSGGIFQINTTASIASNYKFITKTGTDMNLAISEQANQLAIEAANDSLSANVPLRIYASPLYVLSGETIVGGTTDNGAYNLQCNGTGVWGAGAYVNGSDARLKDDIQSLDSCLDVVNALRPVTFRYKPEHSKDQSVQTGFIAQELQQTLASKPYLEGLVQEGPEHLNVAYQNIIPLLTKAIQEQQAMINDLKAKVAALESK